ncbi:MAG: LysM peptidoglycan-binding domain-containing protein [Dermatophilaceae bacterium]
MTTRPRLVGLLATLLVVAILIGLPVTLLALGANPIPTSPPSLEQIRAAVTTPDDGTLALGAVTVLAWAAWLVLAASILLEAAARLRGARAPRLPGFAMPQLAARQLVGAAALLFVVAPATATFATASPAHAAPATLTATAAVLPAAPAPAATTHSGTARPATASTYLVRPGDTLSGIAHRELGAAGRWRDLVHLNPAVAANPNRIHPGTVLVLPAPPTTAAEHTYTVRAGDTLSGIARRELGDPARYRQIFTASKDTPQPGGGHLSDPDTIDVGQTLTIPATGTPPPGPSAPVPAPAPAPAAPGPTPRPALDQLEAAPSPASTPSPAAATPPTIPSSIAGGSTSSSPESGEPAPHGAWMLAGLTGAGALLAGSLWVALRRRRHAQFRHRRPGRTLAAPPPVLGPVEKTITAVGAVTAPTVEHMDVILRRLAAAAARDGVAMPQLTAVELTDTHLVAHLSAPASLPPPWTGSDDQLHWRIEAATPPEQVGPHVVDQPAPYPLLVTIGLGDQDEVWLLNIEDLHVSITGDPTYGQDFARYLAAEVACNPWSAGVEVACLGVAGELAALNPDRIHVYDPHAEALHPVEELLADAVATIDRAEDVGADVATARARRAGADAWPARLLLADAAAGADALEQLLDLVHAHPGQTATSVVVAGQRPGTPGTVLQVSADGRLRMPQAGLDLVAVGLTSDEAEGCAALLAHADTAGDDAVPVEPGPAEGWRAYTDTAGALREEHTQPRQDQNPDGEDAEPTSSLLAEQDEAYLDVAATTTADLQALAPRVDDRVRQHLEDADPTLDDDVAMWFHDDAALPKLHLLGPVRAATRGKPLTKRKPYMTELLTYIALRPNGATPDEVAEAFTISEDKARTYAMTVRQWLGTNPRTGQPHLPDARKSPAAGGRGVPVYQVVDLLVDIDLFRRLRARGQARGGQAGIADLRTALRLVDGRPFDYPLQREDGGGWAWLLEGDRLDEHMAVAIVDVAHIVTTDALAHGDLPAARLAATTAGLAAPYEEIPRLDLAAVATAEGHHAEAQHIIRDQICNRTDDDGAPPELPTRTEQILKQRKRWAATKAS